MVIHGVSVNFGINSSIIGINGAFQARDHAYKVENDSIRDGGDTTVSKVYYDPVETAVFTYVAVQPIFGYRNARIDIPYIGQWVQIVDPQYSAINGWWLCENINVSTSNTTATRVSLNLARYPFVQKI